jgi:DNA-binding HxlR family transcriptional regulator
MQSTYSQDEARGFAEEQCPLAYALELVGGKWRLPVVWELSRDSPLRYNELRRRLGHVTNATLSRVLGEMEGCGLVLRRDYGEIPPRVEYSLTDAGSSLIPALDALYEWGRRQERRLGASERCLSGGDGA